MGVFGDASPKRDELFTILKNSSVPEDKFIIVDDSLIGAKLAKDNNLMMIAVETGKAKKEDLILYTKHVFSDLGDDRWKDAIEIMLA